MEIVAQGEQEICCPPIAMSTWSKLIIYYFKLQNTQVPLKFSFQLKKKKDIWSTVVLWELVEESDFVSLSAGEFEGQCGIFILKGNFFIFST